jgi:hypothetical protein
MLPAKMAAKTEDNTFHGLRRLGQKLLTQTKRRQLLLQPMQTKGIQSACVRGHAIHTKLAIKASHKPMTKTTGGSFNMIRSIACAARVSWHSCPISGAFCPIPGDT